MKCTGRYVGQQVSCRDVGLSYHIEKGCYTFVMGIIATEGQDEEQKNLQWFQ